MTDGEVVEGSIVEQTRLAFDNCIAIMQEAGYGVEDVVHVTTVLTECTLFQLFQQKSLRRSLATTRRRASVAFRT